MLFGLSRSTILAFAAMMFAAAAVSLLPNRAEATCGSHVLVANTSAESHQPEVPMPAKCTGPNCGQAPLPVAPVSVPLGDSNEHGPLAQTGSERVQEAFRSGALTVPANADSFAAYPQEIFNPPRRNPSI